MSALLSIYIFKLCYNTILQCILVNWINIIEINLISNMSVYLIIFLLDTWTLNSDGV